MNKLSLIRRVLCIALAVSVLLPSLSLVVEAASATWLAPQPGQGASGRYVEVSIGYNTQSSLKVTKLELWIDRQFQSKKMLIRPETRGVCSFSWDTSGYANGNHELLVKIYAGSTLVGVVSGAGTVGESIYDMVAPKVKFVGLKNGSIVKGTTTIKVEANDNSGNPPLVSVLVDQKLKLLKNSAPYSYDLDTTSYVDGTHQIETYAFDSEGNKSDVLSVKVNVKNTPTMQAVAKADITVQPASVVVKKAESVKPIAPVVAPARIIIGSAARTSDVSEKTIASQISAVPVAKADSYSKPIAAAIKIKPVVAKATLSEPVYTVSKNKTLVAEKRTVNSVALVSAKMSATTVPVAVIPVAVKTSAVVASNKTILKSLSEPSAFKITSSPKAVSSKPIAAVSAKQAPEMKSVKQTAMVTCPVKPEPIIKMTPDVKSNSVQIAKVTSVIKVEPVKPIVESKPIVMAKSEIKTTPVVLPVTAKPIVVSRSVVKPVVRTKPVVAVKPVQMAMAPVVKKPCVSDKIYVEPKAAETKIIKSTLPAKGSIKVRDLVKKVDGVVLWDYKTRTVTAYANNIKIEMRIGKKLVMVNGKSMVVNLVPSIVRGRTVIDVQLFHKACQVAANNALKKQASAE